MIVALAAHSTPVRPSSSSHPPLPPFGVCLTATVSAPPVRRPRMRRPHPSILPQRSVACRARAPIRLVGGYSTSRAVEVVGGTATELRPG
ncbi:hypothetical protein B0H16DRAFT_1901366 [Mycena metata]|uniref:Uncharacterized protein n=1 Tax=Mycena metata TaxID=1033252 RepID=A0AAD7M9Q1_9AGAR|nr:hypothetical protein B0H16DRAFT_1901366 [Mycena metata]